MIKMVVTDIDGTIYSPETGITKNVKDCIQKLSEQGVIVVIATGRTYGSAKSVADKLGIKCPLICYQGGLVNSYDGEILDVKYLDPEPAKEIIEECNKRNIHLNVYVEDKLYVEDDNEYIKDYIGDKGIDYFKVNYMYKNDFFDAFKNMENYQKAEFNYNLEEICCVLIKIIPIVLQNYYEIIEKLLSISIPNIAQERLKKPETEFQCLNLNYAFFNSSTEFFNICLEVYKVLHSKENRFIYTLTDFGPLNSYLDIVRYCTNNIISISSAHINKTKGDKKILEKLEVGLNIKKGHRKGIDPLERYHLRHRKPESEIDLKIDRVKRALNMKIEKRDYNIQRPWKKIKIIKDNIIPRKHSTFVSGVFTNMLKYFKPDIRRKIIALQVVDRFESRQYEKNSDDDDNNGGGNSKKCFA